MVFEKKYIDFKIKFDIISVHSGVAQSVEQTAVNRRVRGSSPLAGAIWFSLLSVWLYYSSALTNPVLITNFIFGKVDFKLIF